MQGPLFRTLILVFSVFWLAACAGQKPHFVTQYPLEFNVAVETLSKHLLSQIEADREKSKLAKEADIVLDPFVDADSGDVIQASLHIEKILLELGKNPLYKHLRMSRITADGLRNSAYVLNGTLYPQDYEAAGGRGKYFRASASVVDLSSGRVVAASNVWISNLDLDYTPVAFYQDSPVYLKDKAVEGLVATAKSAVDTQAHQDYYDTLDTSAILTEASASYEEGDYANALALFNKAAAREDGKIMRTYAGLYETHYKLGATADAERAFANLLKTSVATNKSMNLKFLFEVNSTAFINNADLRKQYDLWLNQIADYFAESKQCFHIIGHSSRSGNAAYNNQLSLARAKQVQRLLRTRYPHVLNVSKVEGKGFQENIVGLGTDDARDAIDRRVEFMLLDCAPF